MASILTNTSSMAALQTLRSISSSMEKTQNNISTGMRVSSAADNAAYWSIATTMRSDNLALSAVNDALGMGAAKVDVAYAGMEAAIDVVKEIKAKVVAATEQGVDKAKVQEEIDQLKEQLVSIASGASFNGENWLVGAAETKTVVSGFVRDGSDVKVTTSDYDNTDKTLFSDLGTGGVATATGGILGDIVASAFDVESGTLADMLQNIEDALSDMTSAGSALGSISSRISLQENFVSKLSDALERGVGRLVDADMNEESTRLKALQTQQQLAIQALSIANSDSQNILSLFR